ncbi:MAG: esterase/lipase family protein [Solirubrobacterales bacterium]
MTAFAFLHGAWHTGAIWAPVCAELVRRGHIAFAPNLPCDDPTAGSAEHIAALTAATGGEKVVAVGHTTAALVLPLLPAATDVERLVYVNGLPPRIGASLLDQTQDERVGRRSDEGRKYDREARSYWDDSDAAHRLLGADIAQDQWSWIYAQMRPQSRMLIREPTPLTEWPATPTTAVVYTDDADLEIDWMVNVARERLNTTPIELKGSQLGFVADPAGFVDVLLSQKA